MKVQVLAVVMIVFCLMGISVHASDVYVTTKLEPQRLNTYIDHLRQGLRNQTGRDPFQGKIDQEFVIDLTSSIPEVDPATQAWILGLERIFKIDRLGGRLQLKIKGIEFNLAGQNSAVDSQQLSRDKIHYILNTNLQGLRVKIDHMSFSLVLKNGSHPLEIAASLNQTEITLNQKIKAPILSEITTQVTDENFVLSYDRLNIYTLVKALSLGSDQLSMAFQELVMPQVSLSVGQHTLTFQREKIEKYLKDNLDIAKEFILYRLAEKHEDQLSSIFNQSPIKQKYSREQFFPLEIKAGVYVDELILQNKEMVSLGFKLDVCSDLASNYQECHQAPIKSVFNSYFKTLIFMGLRAFPEDADIMVSIAQEKINDFLYASVKKNMWNKILEEENLEWAELGTFLYTDKVGDVFDLYLDVIYKFDRSERILVGRKQIRFPIHYQVKLTVEDNSGIPTFYLKVVDVNLSDDFLLFGNEALGLKSTIHEVPRLKKKVLAKVKAKVGAFNGRTMFTFALPKVLSAIVDRVDFVSDNKGNLHGFFDLKELSF